MVSKIQATTKNRIELMSSDAHIFALFFADVDTIFIPIQKKGAAPLQVRTHDKDLVHRLYRVVRVHPKENVILFGTRYALEVVLDEITSTYITFSVVKQNTIEPLLPIINLWLPLLEKIALEEALYAATVMGVYSIYFITTTKNKRQTLSPTEAERYGRIMIAAAEQSKQFCLPILHKPMPWEEISGPYQLIMADIDGAPLAQRLSKINTKMPCTMIIGPSGGFTIEEKQKLEAVGILKAKLVPTVLRSEDAVMVSLGIMRSFFSR